MPPAPAARDLHREKVVTHIVIGLVFAVVLLGIGLLVVASEVARIGTLLDQARDANDTNCDSLDDFNEALNEHGTAIGEIRTAIGGDPFPFSEPGLVHTVQTLAKLVARHTDMLEAYFSDVEGQGKQLARVLGSLRHVDEMKLALVKASQSLALASRQLGAVPHEPAVPTKSIDETIRNLGGSLEAMRLKARAADSNGDNATAGVEPR
jgi:hypothetical protein